MRKRGVMKRKRGEGGRGAVREGEGRGGVREGGEGEGE